jgi:signal transduction histidine kinase/FixJ family two-component response regulator
MPTTTEVLRLLQVEDSESDAALLVRLLQKSGYLVQAERVEDAASMRQALAGRNWDVVIADYQLPQFDAPEALRIRNEYAPDVPFIVVSGTIGEERAVEMIRAGAQDYVLKDRIARLVPAVQREIQEARARREHRRVQDRLRDRDEWLALVVGSTQLGMFDFYPQSGKLVLSEGGHRHIGLPPASEISREQIISALHPDDLEFVSALVRKAFDPVNGGEFVADFRVIGLMDQMERWLGAQGRVFFDSQGRPIRFVGVTTDITERKELEARLTTLDHAKSDFLTLISHEFRTPLNGLLGVGDLLLEGMPSTEDNNNLRGLFDSCRRRILSILDDALLLARIDVHGEKFGFSPVSLDDALGLAIASAADFATSRGVEIEPPSTALPLVWANEELLTRALQSLLEAAVKFSAKGETIRMSSSALAHSQDLVIESHGTTIPEHSLAKFFDIFSIGEAITAGGDLGLGAPVACRILSLFGALVSVANLNPSGIRLTISLRDPASDRAGIGSQPPPISSDETLIPQMSS